MKTGLSSLLIALPFACLIAAPALGGECRDRIASLEKSLIAPEEGGGPALTGSLQNSGSANASSSSETAPAPNNRIPANRPASAEAAGAQAGATASTEPSTGNSGQDSANRLAANRTPSPESQAAQVQNSAEQSGSSRRMSPADRTRMLAALNEAKSLDSQGREGDCMRALPSDAAAVPPVK
jgi:uncharacterized iron-regulated membrane protein